MDQKCIFWICFTMLFTLTIAQRKPGICPANLNFPICAMSCYDDMHCLGNNKCCRTYCNGAVCIPPLPDEVNPLPVSHKKPGKCPVNLSIPICAMTCPNDLRCRDNNKCCRTQCGGSVCIEPITPRQPSPSPPPPPVQIGGCPAKPGGPWICTSTCATDNNCRAPKKCCKNRCGALTCMKV